MGKNRYCGDNDGIGDYGVMSNDGHSGGEDDNSIGDCGVDGNDGYCSDDNGVGDGVMGNDGNDVNSGGRDDNSIGDNGVHGNNGYSGDNSIGDGNNDYLGNAFMVIMITILLEMIVLVVMGELSMVIMLVVTKDEHPDFYLCTVVVKNPHNTNRNFLQ